MITIQDSTKFAWNLGKSKINVLENKFNIPFVLSYETEKVYESKFELLIARISLLIFPHIVDTNNFVGFVSFTYMHACIIL